MSIRLEEQAQLATTFQSYPASDEIEGVFQRPLRKHVALEGWFMEHLRLGEGSVDVRAESPATGHSRRILLSGDAPSLLHTPTGIAHGYKAGPAGALLVYGMNSQFNLQDPNEGRLPWDFFGSDLWEDDRG